MSRMWIYWVTFRVNLSSLLIERTVEMRPRPLGVEGVDVNGTVALP